MFARARRDVMLSLRPQLQDLRRTGKQARRQYRQSSHQVGDIYGALQDQLAPLGGQYGQQATQIASDLQGQLAGLTGGLGSTVPGVPASEIAAGTGMFGTIGAGALEQLASDRARNAAYQTSAQRQGAEEQAITKRNYLTDLTNFRSDLADQRHSLMGGASQSILQRLADLRDQAFQQSLANKEFQLRASSANQTDLANQAASGFWQDYLALMQRRQGKGGPP